jgi:hypothetical protein
VQELELNACRHKLDFVILTFCKSSFSLWKSILGAWTNVKKGLVKVDAVRSNEILRQLLFGYPQSGMLIIYDQDLVPPMMDMLSQELVVTKLETYGTSKHAVEKAVNLYIFLVFLQVWLPIKNSSLSSLGIQRCCS